MTLTVRDALSIAAICEASIKCSKVARLMDGDIITGTARSIGDAHGNFAGPDDDIRDMYLRVTTTSGFEAFWSMWELIPLHQSGEFVSSYGD